MLTSSSSADQHQESLQCLHFLPALSNESVVSFPTHNSRSLLVQYGSPDLIAVSGCQVEGVGGE